MNRITTRILEILVDNINKEAGTPLTYCDKNIKPYKTNIGHYHLDCAYGGYKLVQVDNEAGGIRTITNSGYTTKRILYGEMQAFLAGLRARK